MKPCSMLLRGHISQNETIKIRLKISTSEIATATVEPDMNQMTLYYSRLSIIVQNRVRLQ